MITRPKRQFLAENLQIFRWEDIEAYYQDLNNRSLDNSQELELFLLHWSELQAVLEEDSAWRYIHMSCDTANEEKREAYEFFVNKIQPKIAPYENRLEQKLMRCELLHSLTEEYSIYLKKIERSLELFREENIPIQAKLSSEAQKYGLITGKMSIEHEGKEYTLQQASAAFLKVQDRQLREEVYRKISDQRLVVSEELHLLFDSLIAQRSELAKNAGFDNFRDYKFAAMCRFDYTSQDCFDFHDSIRRAIVPIQDELAALRKEALALEELRPWDLQVDPEGRPALKPFEKAEDLVQKSIVCFNRLDPYFGECLENMRELSHLDLESRKGKAPGGYNYPLYEIGVPFIFMNAAGSIRDLVTMVHEGGHAIHSFLSRDLKITGFKDLSSEIAELASMSMELLSMEHWDVFFKSEEDLRRAKKEHLEDILSTLPWIALIDKFQHWIYEHPKHSHEARENKWLELHKQFSSKLVDWNGLETERRNIWQKQLHLFEVPFYYIEYGMAQLGAIAMWKQYKEKGQVALDNYKAALSLGYTKSIPEVYERAGIRFDFSEKYIRELMEFVKSEYDLL